MPLHPYDRDEPVGRREYERENWGNGHAPAWGALGAKSQAVWRSRAVAERENCGQGHDTARICCGHASAVKNRLLPAENTLAELDALSLFVLTGTPEQQADAQTKLGELLLGRVWPQAQEILLERARVEAICPNYRDATESP